MALREIVQIGEPVLRKKAKKVEVIDKKIIQVLKNSSYRYRRWVTRTYKS